MLRRICEVRRQRETPPLSGPSANGRGAGAEKGGGAGEAGTRARAGDGGQACCGVSGGVRQPDVGASVRATVAEGGLRCGAAPSSKKQGRGTTPRWCPRAPDGGLCSVDICCDRCLSALPGVEEEAEFLGGVARSLFHSRCSGSISKPGGVRKSMPWPDRAWEDGAARWRGVRGVPNASLSKKGREKPPWAERGVLAGDDRAIAGLAAPKSAASAAASGDAWPANRAPREGSPLRGSNPLWAESGGRCGEGGGRASMIQSRGV